MAALAVSWLHSWTWHLTTGGNVTQKWIHRYEVKPGRWVFVPTDGARKLGRQIKKAVQAHWAAPDFYYHLLAGGHVAAIQRHKARKFFIRADLDDFFGRVSRSRVTRCLKLFFPYRDARDFASQSVVIKPCSGESILPYGFVQSPILASIALDRSKLGSYLRRLSRQASFDVTVYMDDILISSDDEQKIMNAFLDLEKFSDAAGFPLNSVKSEGPKQSVTAFNIDISQNSVFVAPRRMAEFRSQIAVATSTDSLDGIVNYVHSVNPAQVASL
ncbi:reverse transcriptase domain-containing protein [Luteimonas sp. A277]